VARGFAQKYGLDYEKTLCLVAKLTSVKVVIVLAAKMNWKMFQLDVKNAFLNGDLDKEREMAQPEGFVDKARPNPLCAN
jgi:hypothetical protein